MKNWPIHYRLTDHATGPGVEISITRYFPIAETPKGYWVVSEYNRGGAEWEKLHRKWVPKENPRFCSPNIPTAQYSFERRKRIQLRKIQWQLEQCQQVLKALSELGDNDFPSKGLNCGVPPEWEGLRW